MTAESDPTPRPSPIHACMYTSPRPGRRHYGDANAQAIALKARSLDATVSGSVIKVCVNVSQ